MRDLETLCERPRPAVTDLHTHSFNALYLPDIGIFVSWCRHFHVPRAIGVAVGIVVELITLGRSGTRRRAVEIASHHAIDESSPGAVADAATSAGGTPSRTPLRTG